MKSPNFSDRPSDHPYEKVIFTDTMPGSIFVMLIENQGELPYRFQTNRKKFNKLSGDKKFTQVDFSMASIGDV